MYKKVEKWMWHHPTASFWGTSLAGIILCVVLSVFIASTRLLIGVPIILLFSILALWGLIAIDERGRRKLANAKIPECEKMYQDYVNIVNKTIQEKSYDITKLPEDWLIQLHRNFIKFRTNSLVTNDFEMATCLIYALTANDESNLLFAMECAKYILEEPKSYRCYTYSWGELEFEVIEVEEKTNISLLQELLTDEEALELFKIWITSKDKKRWYRIFSDVLYCAYRQAK